MRMNEPSRWQMPGGPLVFSGMVADGNAVDLTNAAPKWMCRRPVAVGAGTYDRFVAWDAEALRKHGLHLEEAPGWNTCSRPAAPPPSALAGVSSAGRSTLGATTHCVCARCS